VRRKLADAGRSRRLLVALVPAVCAVAVLVLALTRDLRWHREAAIGAVLLSLLIGTSRVMLGVHWPSDVAGGWAFGLLWVLLTLRLAERELKA